MKSHYFIALFLLSVLIAGCTQPQPPAGGTGTLVLKITDAMTDLQIEKLEITVSSIQVHKAGEDDANWTTIVEGPETFDLIAIKNVQQLLGSKTLESGKYTQIRLNVDSASGIIDGNSVELTIPSKTIKLVNEFDINADESTTLILDFDAQQSVNETGNGEFKFQPVIKVLEESEAMQKPAARINFQISPSTGIVDEDIEFSWKVTGGEQGKVEHTALHWDTVEHPPDFRTYPEGQLTQVQTGWTPQTFTAMLKFSEAGTYYVRGHAIVDGTNVYTEEIELVVSEAQAANNEAMIEIVEIPSTVTNGEAFIVKWRVTSQEPGLTITKTSINYGWPNVDPPQDTPAQSGTTPQTFEASITAGFGLFLKACATVELSSGSKEICTDVKVPEVKEAVVEARKYTVNVSDHSADPSTLSAKAGETVEITFNVSTQDVYYGGAQIKSDYFDTGTIPKGESKTISFTMPANDFRFTDYWPATSVKKWDAWMRLES